MAEGGGSRFDLPWRIDWTVPREEAAAREAAARVREASPMLVVLTAPSAERLLPLGLPWPGTAVAWVDTGWGSGPPSRWPAVARVELPVSGAAEAEEACRVFGGEGGAERPRLALRWTPTGERLADLPRLLALARERGWGATLPASPAEEAGSAAPWPVEGIPPAGWEAARKAAAALGAELAVHDFSLSRALAIPGPEPAGCEAGDALAFVDEDGAIYACRSLRVPLGRLAEGLEAAWASPARRRLRAALGEPAGSCRACPHLPRCRGGCRGLAYHARGGVDAPDPRCPVQPDGETGSRGEGEKVK